MTSRFGLWFLLFLLMAVPGYSAATLPFRFTLDEDATTSAGVYKPDGTLVRTLWRKVEYTRGEHQAVWDGRTDEKVDAPHGSYSIRVLSHRMDYIWQGSIGNTSTARFGPTMHRGFRPLRDLTITGGDAFYITGYVEGDYDFRHFLTSDKQRVANRWCWYLDRRIDRVVSETGTIYSPEWVATDSDGEWVYFASPDSTDPETREVHVGPGFIVAAKVATQESASFTNGGVIENGPREFEFLPFANGIKVGTKKGLSGIAVKKDGDTLAVSVRSEGKVYLVHKRTGASLSSINVPSPGQLSFAPNGDLWAISGKSLCRILTPANVPVITFPVMNLSDPLDLAVDPSGTFVAVVDAGSSQQVKAFLTATGTPHWTLGQEGGYASHGPDVTRDKFLFMDREGNPGGCIAFGPDGSLWLGDPGNRRLMHFSAERTYLDEIMFQSTSYSTGVDAHNPTRVFADFLEFSVDYSKPLHQGWKLTKNWAANLPKSYFGFGCGVRQVTTLSNGRTYGAVDEEGVQGSRIVELTIVGTRLTNILLKPTAGEPRAFEMLTSSGDVRRGTLFDGSSELPPNSQALFEERRLTGFDRDNNPTWGEYRTLASAPVTEKDPATRCCSLGDFRMPSTSSDVLISFDQTKNNGWHLGGVRKGGTDWLWKASPSVISSVPLDGLGSFVVGDGVHYPGNSVYASGKNVVFGYHGEFWNDTQACQFMHFYDNGLFVGQFGETGMGHETFEGPVPGRAGNSAFSALAEVGGKVYLWTNDESQNGPQRWLLDGTQTIRETSAVGTLGHSEPLIIPVAPNPFPTGVTAKAGDGRVSLTWNPVLGARSYNVRMATSRGGAATLIAGEVLSAGKTIDQLTNGQTYYFSVSAVTETGESVYSNPATATPASLTATVQTAGRYDQPGSEPHILDVTPANVFVRKPALLKLNPLLGDLTLRNVGSSGYRIFNWNPVYLADTATLPFGDTIEPKSGWRVDTYLGYRFRVGGVIGSNYGLLVRDKEEKKGIIEVTPHDGAIYYLTVVMSPQFRDATDYKIRLAPKDQPSLAVGYDTKEKIGIFHIYQFRFRGPVDLTVECPTGTTGVQALFLDSANLIPQEVSNYQLWQEQNFTSPERESSSLSGPGADLDRDGQSNLLEYVMGSSPASPASSGVLLPKVERVQGDDFLTLQFTRSRFARDVTLRVGASSDLLSWIWINPDDLTYRISQVLDIPAKGLETIVVRDVVPAGLGPRFMRLSAQ